MSYDVPQFAEKVQLALQTALKQQPQGGLCGLEMEWNLLDEHFRPLLTVGAGPAQQSFVDYLRAECLPPALRSFSQLEVFHWMIEWATRPYFSARQTVYEARLMEAALINALDRAGRSFQHRLYYWHGNLPNLTEINHQVIPGSWPIAKRRYLERCVDLYGESLATAGIHCNLSLPDPLFAWDFMHLPASERRSRHLDDFKSEFYITASRVLRAYAALFIAASASTPLQSRHGEHGTEVHLTEWDSVRSLTFPNPLALDVPYLYRSYEDYLHLSYELVRSGLRFGNNNWTPVRARSFAEPVERLIAVTSDQLGDLYARGLYVVGGQTGNGQPAEEMARQIEMQNLMARINLPMARVEVRTDDGGHPLDEDVALLTFKHLLLLRIYGDPTFGRAFRYDGEDIARARRNEDLAARHGLRGEIENPFTGKPVAMRAWLRQALDEVLPLAQALNLADELQPLVELAEGAPNAAERLRQALRREIGDEPVVPLDLLAAMARQRESLVAADVAEITAQAAVEPKLNEFLLHAGDAARNEAQTPISFRTQPASVLALTYPDKTSEIVALAEQLIRIPSVTACPEERLDEVRRAGLFILDYLKAGGVGVQYFDQGKYPSLLASFPGQTSAAVMLSGHFDVVPPDPDESQFEPRLDGDYLWGRGAADMKTVVATYLVWMKDRLRQGPPYPAINMMLVGNEENGELEPMGSPHVFRWLEEQHAYRPALVIAGERTGEKGSELYGEVCIQNRGVMRLDILAYGQRGHSGVAGSAPDLSERLLAARSDLRRLISERLTLSSPDGWQSQLSFPFLQVGTPGIYNVTPAQAVLGVEIRSIPQNDLTALKEVVQDYCQENKLELKVGVMENGVAASPDNPYLQKLLQAVEAVSGQPARVGRKLPGTSARFAPAGQGVVWGQTGIGPHSKDERHYLPSIEPYYLCLSRLAEMVKQE